MSDSLEQIATEVEVCTRCPLHHSRVKAVPGEGPATAKIMFIGEGPGFHENQSGRPFVGPAGDFLNELLHEIGLRREDVFIGNVVKCRPPSNRDPEPMEIESCKDYLDRQIEAINPQVIVTLGRFSMARWFPAARISQVHGQARKFGSRLVVPMFHPAAALHQPSLRQQVIDDFKKLPGYLNQLDAGANSGESEESPPDQPQQLSLF